jgi:3-oxoacyl-[acyl-carrier-protein] synthase II
MTDVVITGMGMVTPLGDESGTVADRVLRNESAARPVPISPPVACRRFAPLENFDAGKHFPDNKALRLMNRDALLAVVAARRAIEDAALVPGVSYPPEEIALYGATGLSGMASAEIARLVGDAAAPDGSLDLQRFGSVTLRRIRPVLSFKILANMPVCFVSIFENLRGPNAVYTPWEGNGAQAIAAGVRAIRTGDVPCALVGGCDVKTHSLSLITLQQQGVFDSWMKQGDGCVPGEGAAFLVLEDRRQAVRRGVRMYARLGSLMLRSVPSDGCGVETLGEILDGIESHGRPFVVAAGDGDAERAEAERAALAAAGIVAEVTARPKGCLGNLFAAAAAVQVTLAAVLASRSSAGQQVLANCFGHGSEQASFLLEAV